MRPQLSKLAADIKACRICVETPSGAPLPHEPNPVAVLSSKATIAICGQAPGNKVNLSGVPFTDPSGERLRDWMGVTSEAFYNPDHFAIIPMGFCFPGNDAKGGDLRPRKECRLQWHDSVFEAMPHIELKLLIGGSAQSYHLGRDAGKTVTETVRNWRVFFERNASIPMPHPSWRNTGWLKKNLWFERELLPVLREAVKKRISVS
ncbi:MAG: uracil-DNA glycosylase family protein [Salaquimonas sp.]